MRRSCRSTERGPNDRVSGSGHTGILTAPEYVWRRSLATFPATFVHPDSPSSGTASPACTHRWVPLAPTLLRERTGSPRWAHFGEAPLPPNTLVVARSREDDTIFLRASSRMEVSDVVGVMTTPADEARLRAFLEETSTMW